MIAKITEEQLKKMSQTIASQTRWSINQILDPTSNKVVDSCIGYFGKYICITYKKKQAIIKVDLREAKVKLCTGWYDEIFYDVNYSMRWDADYRWNSDKPLLVRNSNKYNIIAPHSGQELCKTWVTSKPNPVWVNVKNVGEVLVCDNRDFITKNGEVISCIASDVNTEILRQVKKMTIDQVIAFWIFANKPCGYQRGLSYKGAGIRILTDRDEALELIKTHRNFDGMFNSLSWEIVFGQVTLVFHDYCDSDYD